jgi:hypothetical protein
MENLKVPVGWPPVPISVSAMSTMKLEQALAFAGDLGQYVVGLLDIDDVLRTHFLAYLRVLKDCMQKTPVIPVADIKARLDQAAASLEAILPHYWTHVTKHSAVHLDLFLINWGCFWAANELVHERIMAKLKRLAKHGNKNRMATLAKNWDTFQTANDWLLDSDLDLKYEVINYTEHAIIHCHLCYCMIALMPLLDTITHLSFILLIGAPLFCCRTSHRRRLGRQRGHGRHPQNQTIRSPGVHSGAASMGGHRPFVRRAHGRV